MKRLKAIPLIAAMLLLLLFGGTRAWAQGSTSKGTEFWTTWMAHINGATGSSPSKMSLYITSDVSTSGSITIADGSTPIPDFTVIPNQVTIVDIPISAYIGTEGQFNKGIHITSLKPIAVYAHIYAMSVSGATLLLPVNTMGKSYFSLNYTQISNSQNAAGTGLDSHSTFAVIATENNTTIEITPTALLTSNKPAGTAFTVILNKGEVYQALSLTDLTGTKIRSISTANEPCKKIAVFSGSTKLGIGCINANVKPSANNLSADNLFQQVYPTATWGKNYVTVSLKNRRYDIYRIVLSDPNTVVTLNGNVVPIAQFKNNLYYDFTSTGVASNVVSADKPIQMVQYTPTQNQLLNVCPTTSTTDVGDPEMIYLTPIEQGLDHVTLYSTGYYNITQSYINVVIPTSAVSSFTIDGIPYAAFTPVTGKPDYSFAQISVTSGPNGAGTGNGTVTTGTHNISASLPFNAIAYGFGNAESYGYAAGTNLKNLNEFIELKNPVTNMTSASGCVSVTYKPQINIPYKTSKISWDLKDGRSAVVTTPTAPDTTITKNGQTLYVYNYPNTVTYTTAGSYAIVATVLNPTADDCGSNEDIEFDYIVSDIPNAKFSSSAGAKGICPGDEVTFTDETATNGIVTKTWSWHFGDDANATAANPNTATNANPKHIYTTPGDYTVTLTVENQNGCATTSLPLTIHVNKAPSAAFSFSNPDCETRGITFTDASVANEGTLNKWVWDFDDGTPVVTKTDNLPFTHVFASANTYKVSLTVTSSTGCVSDAKIISVVIHPLPQVDFNLPDVCLSDAFAQFTNKTMIADNSDSQLTYSWDFGDAANSTALNPNTSALPNPKHKYIKTGNYQVTLTVTSKDNCVVNKNNIVYGKWRYAECGL